jgi:phosphoglycerate dehydrogenase-like enzyme/2-polyprenyl-6-methoxyphenol hydroxylase-like FAD-dependent oxidoreductase
MNLISEVNGMPVTPLPTNKKVLISGASIAGPMLAYWLCQYGFDVTIVERAASVRDGGYPIDIRGTAIEAMDRTGLLPKLRAAHIDAQKITFVGADGLPIASIPPEALTGGELGRDIELPRGTLTSLLFDLTQREHIRYRFSDSIAVLAERDGGVDVRFKSGESETFDIVVGADGLHSNTRRLVFGAEQQFTRYLGWCFCGFTIPNYLGLSHEGVTYATPGRAAVLYAVRNSDTLHAFLQFASRQPPFLDGQDLNGQDSEAQRQLTVQMLSGEGWEVPRMIEALIKTDDFFFDSVSQIHMPVWSSGRVVLVGDAAHASSFLSGQGSSLALVGAYVLAGELASHQDPAEAFASYERICRPFVEANQALASPGRSVLLPTSQEQLERRNQALAAGEFLASDDGRAAKRRKVHSSLQLPNYDPILRMGRAPLPRVAILDDYAHVALDLADWSPVKQKADVTVFDRHLSEDEAVEVLQSFDVVCTLRERMAFPRTLIERLPNLKLMTIVGMSLPNLDMAAASDRGILVAHPNFANPGFAAAGTGVPELTWGLLMATVRNLGEEHRRMREGGWQATAGVTLSGKTLGLLGLGRLGKRMAEYAKVFGMEVIAWSQNLTDEAAAAVGVRRVEKEALFRESDVISIGLVLSERTRGLVAGPELALMKPSAYLINISRGPIVDEAALVAALQAGRIAGAGLDVYDTEPLPSDHPLRFLPNVTLSPHLGYVTRELLAAVYADTVEAVAAWLDGKPVRIANREALQGQASTG